MLRLTVIMPDRIIVDDPVQYIGHVDIQKGLDFLSFKKCTLAKDSLTHADHLITRPTRNRIILALVSTEYRYEIFHLTLSLPWRFDNRKMPVE